MHPDLLRHFLDHHRLQLVNAFFQEILLAADDGVADFQNRLLSLLYVFNELDRTLKAFLDVIARIAIIALAA